mmetsp:Transcript_22289/g.53001  ORF Transcript_22289/g.53001 Transcript_22289/m.53001 type:complete len:101 (-) Transcript_22289:1680-1982(-)
MKRILYIFTLISTTELVVTAITSSYSLVGILNLIVLPRKIPPFGTASFTLFNNTTNRFQSLEFTIYNVMSGHQPMVLFIQSANVTSPPMVLQISLGLCPP